MPAPYPAAYLSESASWDADRRALESRSRRTAWIIAGIAVFTTCMAIAALLLMVPLKRVDRMSSV